MIRIRRAITRLKQRARGMRLGITFHKFGDDITWIWPWRRVGWDGKINRRGRKFLSALFESEFNSLAEIDRMWTEFDEYNRLEAENC